MKKLKEKTLNEKVQEINHDYVKPSIKVIEMEIEGVILSSSPASEQTKCNNFREMRNGGDAW